MKPPFLLLLLCLLLAQCGKKTSEFNSGNTDRISNVSIDNSSVSSEEFLTIKGKNIWVRDEPGTGKVVMKLNEGDQCKVFGHEQFEIIRGQADYWYQIEFNGQKGWVFGAQTDKSGREQPTILAANTDDFWKKLSEFEKGKCKQGIDPGIAPGRDEPDEGPDCYCEFNQDGMVQSLKAENSQVPEKIFAASYLGCNVANVARFTYEKISSDFSKIAFVNITSLFASSGVSTYRSSIYSIQQDNDFKYYDKAELNGWVSTGASIALVRN